MSDARTTAEQAAQALVSARAGRLKVATAAQSWAPATIEDAYAVQAAVAPHTGAVGGWKVGAPAPDGLATFAPLPASGLVESGVTLADGVHRMRGIEVEVALRLSQDLSPRDEPYTRDEVSRAIDAAIPVIEVVETRLDDRDAAAGMWALADSLSHGELVLGEPIQDWHDRAIEALPVRLHFNADEVLNRTCRNAGGHPVDLVVRLANLCGEHCGGLHAGQIVTTGSLMGIEVAPFQAAVTAVVGDLGEVAVSFG